jgi:uncharacterized protein YecE (DUF72 family)
MGAPAKARRRTRPTHAGRAKPRSRPSSAVRVDRAGGTDREPGRIRVGTASWSDPGFVAEWYPKKLRAADRLGWYAEHFRLVEVNSTFYAVPSANVVASWCRQTPDDFVFDVKLHRLLSRHSTPVAMLPRGLRSLAGGTDKAVLTPKLEGALVDVIREAIEPMVDAGKLGALLLQLSPAFGPRDHSLAELDSLLDRLAGYRVAVELRNRNWLSDERRDNTIGFFRDWRVTWVTVDAPPGDHFMIMPANDVVTDRRLAYLRAHGRNTKGYVSGRSVAARFDYDYSNAELHDIADRAEQLSKIAIDTHIIFNNNKGGYAPSAAGRFQRIVAGQPATANT